MTTSSSSRAAARLALSFRQRQFEWQLAREQQTRAAGKLVSGKTHDLLNLVQIVKLAVEALEPHTAPAGHEFLVDLAAAAESAQRELAELMAVARPEVVVSKGAPVGAAVQAAIVSLGEAMLLQVHLATSPDTCTRCTAVELEHVLIGLALDLVDYPGSPVFTESGAGITAAHGHVELSVRERVISGKPFIEILRAAPLVPPGDRFELRAVEAIAEHAGGELATSERRGGGEEVIVALPVVS